MSDLPGWMYGAGLSLALVVMTVLVLRDHRNR